MEDPWSRCVVRLCQIGILLVGLYFVIGFLVLRSSILGESAEPNSMSKARIVVREVHSAPLWMWPLGLIVEDAPQNRFEYYRGSQLVSCDSYWIASGKAHSAEIKWVGAGEAVVSLDATPIYICKAGHWKYAPHQ